ncbi:hypothetical protein ABIA06_003090 [Bradyrhizobium yuanmingense]
MRRSLGQVSYLTLPEVVRFHKIDEIVESTDCPVRWGISASHDLACASIA